MVGRHRRRLSDRLEALVYERSKQTDQTLAGVQGAFKDALQWLIDDGLAASVDVLAWWALPGFLAAVVTILQAGGATHTVTFQTAWPSS